MLTKILSWFRKPKTKRTYSDMYRSLHISLNLMRIQQPVDDLVRTPVCMKMNRTIAFCFPRQSGASTTALEFLSDNPNSLLFVQCLPSNWHRKSRIRASVSDKEFIGTKVKYDFIIIDNIPLNDKRLDEIYSVTSRHTQYYILINCR